MTDPEGAKEGLGVGEPVLCVGCKNERDHWTHEEPAEGAMWLDDAHHLYAPPSLTTTTPEPVPDQVLTPLSAEGEKPMYIREAWAQYMTIVGAARARARNMLPLESTFYLLGEKERAQEIVERAIRAPLEAHIEVIRNINANHEACSYDCSLHDEIAAALAGVPKEAQS